MTNDQFEIISQKLDMLVRLTALSLVSDKPQQERFIILSSSGFQPKDIADICGTTPNTVRVTLSKMRKQPKGTVENGKNTKK